MIAAPYSMEQQFYMNKMPHLFHADDQPFIGTTQVVMGHEAKIVILSIAKTASMGFLNKKGFWNVELTRNKLANIIVANDDALQAASSRAGTAGRKRQFEFYSKLVEWNKNAKSYTAWPAGIKPKRPAALPQRPLVSALQATDTDMSGTEWPALPSSMATADPTVQHGSSEKAVETMTAVEHTSDPSATQQPLLIDAATMLSGPFAADSVPRAEGAMDVDMDKAVKENRDTMDVEDSESEDGEATSIYKML